MGEPWKCCGQGRGEGWGQDRAEEESAHRAWVQLLAGHWGVGDRKDGGKLVWGRCSVNMRHDSHLSRVPSRLKVTSASIHQLQVQPLHDGRELMINVPLDMVAGFNT